MRTIIAAALIASASLSHAGDVVIDIPSISGKTKPQVEAVIGAPETCEPSKYGERCKYAKAETQIVFIKGHADWISVDNMGDLRYGDDAIKRLGLKPARPDTDNQHVISWKGIQGLLEVSLFPASGKVRYAYIKARTP